jgi:hypothetical protein
MSLDRVSPGDNEPKFRADLNEIIQQPTVQVSQIHLPSQKAKLGESGLPDLADVPADQRA